MCVCVTCVSEQLAAIIRSATGRAVAARRSRWSRHRRGVPRPPNRNIRRCWTSTIRNKTPIRLENRSRARWVRHWSILRHCRYVPVAVCAHPAAGVEIQFLIFRATSMSHYNIIHRNIMERIIRKLLLSTCDIILLFILGHIYYKNIFKYTFGTFGLNRLPSLLKR